MLKVISDFIETTISHFNSKHDPVFNCPVYLDSNIGNCSHVDGILCDFPNCEIIERFDILPDLQVGDS